MMVRTSGSFGREWLLLRALAGWAPNAPSPSWRASPWPPEEERGDWRSGRLGRMTRSYEEIARMREAVCAQHAGASGKRESESDEDELVHIGRAVPAGQGARVRRQSGTRASGTECDVWRGVSPVPTLAPSPAQQARAPHIGGGRRRTRRRALGCARTHLGLGLALGGHLRRARDLGGAGGLGGLRVREQGRARGQSGEDQPTKS